MVRNLNQILILIGWILVIGSTLADDWTTLKGIGYGLVIGNSIVLLAYQRKEKNETTSR